MTDYCTYLRYIAMPCLAFADRDRAIITVLVVQSMTLPSPVMSKWKVKRHWRLVGLLGYFW